MKILYYVSLVIVLLISACSINNNNSHKNTNDSYINSPKTDDNDVTISQDGDMVGLEIYLYNNNSECVPTTSLIPVDTPITAELIVKEVIANFDNNVIINDIEEKKDYVTVSFDSESAPLIGISKATEEAILDCIAYSLIDNLEKCNKIYYKTDKGDYKSDDIYLSKNEPYLTR